MNYNADNLKIRENSWIAKIAAKKLKSTRMAIVIGSTIYLHNTSREAFLQNEQWVKHEVCHLKQFRQHGFLKFLGKYLLEHLKNGYQQNKFELEAQRAEQL